MSWVHRSCQYDLQGMYALVGCLWLCLRVRWSLWVRCGVEQLFMTHYQVLSAAPQPRTLSGPAPEKTIQVPNPKPLSYRTLEPPTSGRQASLSSPSYFVARTGTPTSCWGARTPPGTRPGSLEHWLRECPFQGLWQAPGLVVRARVSKSVGSEV